MKRILCFALLVVFLCGCQGKQPTELIGKGLSFGVDLTYYNEEFKCDGTVSQDGVMILCVREPEDLNGLTFTYRGKDVTAEYMGLTYTPDCGKMPVGCAASLLYHLFGQVGTSEELPQQNEGQLYLEGKADGYWYRFFFSPVGLPLSFEVPACGLEGIFRDVTLIS